MSLRQFGAWGEAAVYDRDLVTELLHSGAHVMNVSLVETHNAVAGLDFRQGSKCFLLNGEFGQPFVSTHLQIYGFTSKYCQENLHPMNYAGLPFTKIIMLCNLHTCLSADYEPPHVIFILLNIFIFINYIQMFYLTSWYLIILLTN